MAVALDLQAAVRRYTRLLLDTTVLIHEFKRQVSVLERIPRPQRATSLVAVWEFIHRAEGQMIPFVERRERREWMDRQGIRLEWVSPGSEPAFRNLLWHVNVSPGVADCLLAAESISRRWPLVTRNVQDFADVDGMFIVPY